MTGIALDVGFVRRDVGNRQQVEQLAENHRLVRRAPCAHASDHGIGTGGSEEQERGADDESPHGRLC